MSLFKKNSIRNDMSVEDLTSYISSFLRGRSIQVEIDDEYFYVSDVFYDDDEDEFHLDLGNSRRDSMNADLIKESIEETLEEIEEIGKGYGDDVYVLYKGKKYGVSYFDDNEIMQVS